MSAATEFGRSVPTFGEVSEVRSKAAFEAELRSWALLAVGSLAIAGLFAFLLALSRLPGIEKLVR